MRSDQELQAFATEHLSYELGMLAGLTKRLLGVLEHDREAGKPDLEWLDRETRNAQVESFAIHARLLLDFFYPSNPRDDDVLAKHFVDGSWKPPALTPALSELRQRVGKGVAHLTYSRLNVTEEEKQWLFAAICSEFGHVVRAFAAAASSERLPEDVRETMRELYREPKRSAAGIMESAALATTTATLTVSEASLPPRAST
jgi:hypothetical protein